MPSDIRFRTAFVPHDLEAPLKGAPTGPLAGLTAAIKDMYDIKGTKSGGGNPDWLKAATPATRNASVIQKLLDAGATVIGKTISEEFFFSLTGANVHYGIPVNARAPGRVPGGSSSGSAAAVAAHMVPGAIGSQTNGSVIRPAAFCGVVGFKPTHGLIPRSGALLLARTLDTVGVFARTVEDAGLLAETLVGFDDEDFDTRPVARPPFAAVAASEPPLPPRFAFVRSPAWEHAEPATRDAFAELVDALGEAITEVDLGASFERATDFHRTIMEVEMAHNLHRDYEKGRDQLSAPLRKIIERGRSRSAVDYTAAVAAVAPLNEALDSVFDEYDAIVTPAAPGEAPRGLESTGNPIFCTLWTYLGAPAVTLPLMQSEAGLPLGVQLVGRRDGDARLLRSARWLVTTIGKKGRRRGEPIAKRSDAARTRKARS